MRTYATFKSTFPDDQREEDGRIVAPGGRNVMEYLREQLIVRGFNVAKAENHEDFGWAFAISLEDCSVWCLLQFAEPWLLISELHVGLLKRLFHLPAPSSLQRVCESLHDIIVSSPSLLEPKWFTREEYEESKGLGGHDRP
jgi:hypothetical protein